MKNFLNFKSVPSTVLWLGVVSLLTDFSSEMIYPLIPVFLSTELGAGAVALGLIEGVAETTAALFKVISGIWTDRASRRKPFILAGYGVAGAVRPLISIVTHWPLLLVLRFIDRVGKGVRTSPRDALITDVTPREKRGAAFGIQRSMDHAGAVIGPLVAAGLLVLAGLKMRMVFFLASIPALIGVLIIIFGIRDAAVAAKPEKKERLSLFKDWKNFDTNYKLILISVFLFVLGNSTDAFLILRLQNVGVPVAWLATLWALHHVVKMVASYLCGNQSDRIGHKKMLLIGWCIYGVIYLAFAVVTTTPGLIAVFLLYGLYFGFAEPSERAIVAALAPEKLRGTAFGYFHFVVGMGALPASLLFGLVWQAFGAPAAFVMGAALALLASAVLFKVKTER